MLICQIRFVDCKNRTMALCKPLKHGLINFGVLLFRCIYPTDYMWLRYLLYVDNMIISGNDVVGIIALKTYFIRTFKMKNLGPLTYFLSLQISRTKDVICFHQQIYVEDLLSFAHLSDSKTIDPTMYWQLVGSLIYLTMTHPDNYHVIQLVSQFVSNLHKPHLTTIHTILC